MPNNYNVLIVGAGNIGAFFDTPYSEGVLTHAHGFTSVDGFNLIGFVDADILKAQKAAEIWGGAAFESIRAAFYNTNIDVVSVAVPDQFHYEVLKHITEYPVKLVFIEKPIAKTLLQAKEIMDDYQNKGIASVVNYSRRFVPEFEDIRKSILLGAYGKFITGNGYYGKGILHNGSHMIDFLRYMVGEIKETTGINHFYDFYHDDPSMAASILFDNGSRFSINPVPCENYTIFEMDLLFEKKRLRFTESAFEIEEYEVKDSKIFAGYRNMVKANQTKSSLGKAMLYAVENIKGYLEGRGDIACTIEDGFKVMEVCLNLKDGIV